VEDMTKHVRWDEFQDYHRDHPETYDFFARMAHEAIRRGIVRGSIRALVQYGRWETGRDFSMGSGFNHDFEPLYARLLMEQEPDLRGFFETRTLLAVRRD
jgi:hypothetical protein